MVANPDGCGNRSADRRASRIRRGLSGAVPGIVVAALVWLGSPHGAQGQEAVPADVQAQVAALIEEAAALGDAAVREAQCGRQQRPLECVEDAALDDAAALEAELARLAQANPTVAAAIADIAVGQLPAGLAAELEEILVLAITRGVIGGVPEAAGDVVAAVSANRPEVSETVAQAAQDTLAALASPVSVPAPPPPAPPPGGLAFLSTAENPSTDAASPAR